MTPAGLAFLPPEMLQAWEQEMSAPGANDRDGGDGATA